MAKASPRRKNVAGAGGRAGRDPRPADTPHRTAAAAVFVLFFASGGVGLVYQVSWARHLTLEFGSTSLAVATVVAVFMSGLALGARLAGRRADGLRGPLRAYGWLEMGLGLYAVASPWLFDAVLSFWVAVGSRLGDSVPALSLVRLGVAVVLLLPPTVLMGATLPLLSRHYVLRIGEEGGRGAGLLYGINTCGAFAGTVVAGFFLLPWWGLQMTLVRVGLFNVLLGAVAWRLSVGERRAKVATPGRRDVTLPPPRVILAVVTATGFASIACEVVWTRVMVLVLGASAYAFTTILAVFLAGLGLGAWLFASRMLGGEQRAWTVATLLSLVSAGGIVLSLTVSSRMPELFRVWFWAWDLEGHPGRVVPLQLALAAIVMFVPALAMGGILPAAMRIVVTDRSRTGHQVGVLYAWNTWGSVLGSLAAGFLLIPVLGLAGSLLLGAAVYGVCALALARASGRLVVPVAVAAAVTGAWAAFGPTWDPVLMTSAMYYYAGDHRESSGADLRDRLDRASDMLYYEDGLMATVTVNRARDADGVTWITVNGKIDGSTGRDMSTQRLLANIPLALHPSPRTAALIGLGTGATAGSAALHAGTRVTALEIEGAVVEAATLFRRHNHSVHERPNVDIRVTDGRLYLQNHPAAFDVVMSGPSNPWQSGNGDLFTSDFYRIGIRSLRPGGVFAQWMALYGLSPESLRTLLRTFTESFPHPYLFQTFPSSDLVLVGSLEPLELDAGRIGERIADPQVRADLEDPRIEVASGYDLVSHLLMGPEELRQLAGTGPLHTDDHPIVYYRAPLEMLRTSFGPRNFALLQARAPGACRYLRAPEAATLAEALSAVEESYRRWRVPTPSGPAPLWGRQADECRRMGEALSSGG